MSKRVDACHVLRLIDAVLHSLEKGSVVYDALLLFWLCAVLVASGSHLTMKDGMIKMGWLWN